MKTRQLMRLALALSLGLALHVVERMLPLPALPFPGVKLGLANLVSLAAVFWFPFSQGLVLIILRCLMASFFGGGFSAFLYSVSGGILSFSMMWLLAYFWPGSLTIPAVSVAGAVMHNVAQIGVSVLLMQTLGLIVYLPVLIVAGSMSGLAIGFSGLLLLKALYRSGRTPDIPPRLLPLLNSQLQR